MLFFYTNVSSQSFVDRNDWRHHPNLKDIKSASIHDNKIYCFAKSGFFFFDLYNNSIVTDGSSLDFISTEFDFSFSNSKYLITGNNSGLIQVISNDENFFLNIDGVTSDFKINSFMVHKEVLYVSSSEGLFKIDLENQLVLDKYYNIGEGGSAVGILDSKIINDTLYVVSVKNIYFINIESNLLDFNLWNTKHFSEIELKGSFIKDDEIYFFSSQSVFNINNEALYAQEDINIQKVLTYNSEVHIIFLSEEKTYYVVLNNNNISEIFLPEKVAEINDILIVDNETWLVGNNFSLYNLSQDQFYSPKNKLAFDVNKISSLNDFIYAFSLSDKISYTSDYSWENETLESFSNITSLAYFNNFLFFGSETDGILNKSENYIINKSFEGSLLSELSDNTIHVSDLKAFEDRIWILNYGSKNPLLSFDNNYNWNTYSLGNPNEIFPIQFEFADDDALFMILDKSKGGGVLFFNIATSESRTLSSANGRLNSNLVNDIVIDKNGLVWIASEEGLIYFLSHKTYDIDDYFLPNDGTQNIFQGINVSSLLLDHSNNIWVGTDEGLFVYNHDKNEIIHQFNTGNSSLLSNKIDDIKMRQDGEVYILTERGLLSISTYIKVPENSFDNLIFYPNPLKLKDDNKMIFSGLQTENYLKIVSLSGEEIIQFNITGGGFSWDLKNANGTKIISGTYLVFILNEDGSQGELVAKFLVL
ncbi:MAG: hypothetical protein CMB64_06750 [Euryarchaeota archaeon]|nr:hypothetical protein [Euryarchaeota archaeon]